MSPSKLSASPVARERSSSVIPFMFFDQFDFFQQCCFYEISFLILTVFYWFSREGDEKDSQITDIFRKLIFVGFGFILVVLKFS